MRGWGRREWRARVGAGACAVLVGAGALVAIGAPAGAGALQVSESFTTAGFLEDAFAVPEGICAVTIVADGGHGGHGYKAESAGGAAAQVTARVRVSPGAMLDLLVGGSGGDWNEPGGTTAGDGGVGGGGAAVSTQGSAGGGGASAVSVGGAPLVVAGAGGGGGGSATVTETGGNGGLLGQSAGSGTGSAAGGGASSLGGGGSAGIDTNFTPSVYAGAGGGVATDGGGFSPGAGDGGDGTGLIGGGGGSPENPGGTGGAAGQTGAGGAIGLGVFGGAGSGNGGDGGDVASGHFDAAPGGGGGIGFAGGGGGWFHGGGGGGGYGGGGGGAGGSDGTNFIVGGGGGGGGSSYVYPTWSLDSPTSQQSVLTGDGQITISYDQALDACGATAVTLFDGTTPGADTGAATIPANVCAVTVTVEGGKGGDAGTGVGGAGARVSALTPVSAGDVLDVFVGGAASGSNGGLGGGGGGSTGSQGGGGGASSASISGAPIAVAGGGGGASTISPYNWDGGAAGLLGADAGSGAGDGGAPGGKASGQGSEAPQEAGAGGSTVGAGGNSVLGGDGGAGDVTGTIGGGGGGAGFTVGGTGGAGGTGTGAAGSGPGGSGGAGNGTGGNGGSTTFSGGGGGGGIGFGGGGGGAGGNGAGGGGGGFGGGAGGNGTSMAAGGAGGGGSSYVWGNRLGASSASTRTTGGRVTITYDPTWDLCVPAISTTTAITADTPDPSLHAATYTVSGTVTVNGTLPVGDLPGSVEVTGEGSGCTDTTLVHTSGSVYGFSCDVTGGSTNGSYTLTATFLNGDSSYSGSSATASHEIVDVIPIPTTTTAITSDSPDPSAVGTSYTVSGTVTVNGTGPASTLPGTVTVTVSDDGAGCTDSSLGVSGTANVYDFSCSAQSGTTPGEVTATATYADSGTDYDGSFDTESHEVVATPPIPSTTTVITNDTYDPTISGSVYTVAGTVTVDGTGPLGPLPGSVAVTVSDMRPGCTDSVLSATATANVYAFSCVVTSGPSGSVTLTATYTDVGTSFGTSSDTEAHEIQAKPLAPGNPTATVPGPGSRSTQVNATVPPGPTPTGYQVRCMPLGVPFDTSPNQNPYVVFTGGPTLPVTVNGLARGKTYHCKVRARYGPEFATERGDWYEGPLSAWTNSFLVPVIAPPAPVGVAASTPTAANPRQTKVTWTKVPNDTGAAITFSVKCVSSNGGVTRSATGGGSPVKVNSLTRRKTYVCQVRATNSKGSSAWVSSNAITAR